MDNIFVIILSNILTFIGGGGLIYFLNLKAIKKLKNLEADEKCIEVQQKKIETIKNIETIHTERIENLLRIIDDKNDIFIKQKEETLNLKIQLKECEEQLKLLKFEIESLNKKLNRKNSELTQKINQITNKN